MVPSADMNPGSQGAASGPAADSGTGTDSDDSQVDEVDDSPLDEVDEWGEESFPASDPPSSWSGPLDT